MKRFWPQEAEMSLTAISSLESAWKNYLMNSTYMRRYFSWTRLTCCLENRKETFLSWGSRNESNTHQFALIGKKKIFHELAVHHVYKVGIKRFCAQVAEMSLTPISWLESARRYFSWTRRTWCLESSNETFLGSGGRNESNTHQFTRINLKKFSHEFDAHDDYKVGIKRFWAQGAEMGKTANSSLVSARKKFFMNPTYMMSRK